MLLLAQSGQRSAALAQYELCRQALRSELDVEPDPDTLDLVARIRAGSVDKQRGRLGEGEKGRQETSAQFACPCLPPLPDLALLPNP